MYLILAVYDALRTFDRPCTRAELGAASDLVRDEVRNGLDGLRRRGAVIVDGAPRERTAYMLRPGADRPTDLRGNPGHTKSPEMRAKISAGVMRVRHTGRR